MDPEAESNPDLDEHDDQPEFEADDHDNEDHDDGELDLENDDEGDEDDDAERAAAKADEEFEEIEFGGGKHKLPKALKPLLLMQQDYTKKTTDLATERQTWEQSRTQQAAADDAFREQLGEVHSLRAAVKGWTELDWDALEASDPAVAQSYWRQFQQTKDALASAEGGLQTKVSERLQGQQEQTAKAMKETGAVLARDIPDFTPELAGQIANYGVKEFGVSQEEVREMADPRLWKVLHRAMTAEGELRKLKTAKAQGQRQAVQPAKAPGGKPASSASGPNDRMSTDAWLKARNAQIAKRR